MMNEMKLRVKSRIENEAFVRMSAAAFLLPLALRMDVLMEIKTILAEGVTNAMIHAYEGNEEAFVEVSIAYDRSQIVIEIVDEGCGIADINQARMPLYTSKAHLERSGMGMTIMETFADVFTIESNPGKGTRLKLVKHLGQT